MKMVRMAGGLLAVTLAMVAPAHAQLTGFSVVKNAGNSADENGTFGLLGTTAFERKSAVSVLSTDSSSGRARYGAVWGADSRVVVFSTGSRTENMAIDWNVNFSVTAPGAYILHASESMAGAFTNNDAGGSGQADLSAVRVTQTGATFLNGGTLDLPDSGTINTSSSLDVPFSSVRTADLIKTSNGVIQAHSFRFTAEGNAISNSSGDKIAVRLGVAGTNGDISATQYPGPGSRVVANDGIFFSVWVESLCGNNVVDASAGEQCDTGALNGTGTSCCTSTCQISPAATVCRTVAGICDVAEVCDGLVGTCPANGFQPNSVQCRSSNGVCDPAENCSGSAPLCPVDAKSDIFTICRAAVDVCDRPEQCDGVSDGCGPDGARPNTVTCRPSAGFCDVVEKCDGVNFACPPDAKQPDTLECRGSLGVCDPAENCDGVTDLCPADAKSTAECRPVADVCDAAENCTGVGNDCPPDVFLASHGGAFVCRASVGGCDPQEICDSGSPACPADVISTAGTTCRAVAGLCDIAEVCDGTNGACPADVYFSTGVVCRGVTGVCDIQEVCTGTGPACPANAFLPSTTVCRAAVDVCDLVENCTGTGANCPTDLVQVDTDADTLCDIADNCVGVPNLDQANGDGDAFGDLCDFCTNPGAVSTTSTNLILKKLNTPVGDDKLKFQGQMVIPVVPELNLIATGARLIINDSLGNVVLDAVIPAGLYNPPTKTGWTGNAPGLRFKYKNGSNLAVTSGIEKIAIKPAAGTPGRLKFTVKGKTGSYAVNPSNLPVRLTFIVEGSLGLNGQCAETYFPGPAPLPACGFNTNFSNLRCR
jgi:hypothetical protein